MAPLHLRAPCSSLPCVCTLLHLCPLHPTALHTSSWPPLVQGGSNFGKCVSLFAPGDKIVSLGSSSDTAVSQPDSGTSFSSPHVAGVLAELAAANPEASLEEVQGMLLNNTLNGVIDGVPKGTANKLLHKACKGSN